MGHITVLRSLIQHGCDVNCKHPVNTRTVTHTAAHHGHVECVQLLLEAGADVDIKDKDGYDSSMCWLLC